MKRKGRTRHGCRGVLGAGEALLVPKGEKTDGLNLLCVNGHANLNK